MQVLLQERGCCRSWSDWKLSLFYLVSGNQHLCLRLRWLSLIIPFDGNCGTRITFGLNTFDCILSVSNKNDWSISSFLYWVIMVAEFVDLLYNFSAAIFADLFPWAWRVPHHSDVQCFAICPSTTTSGRDRNLSSLEIWTLLIGLIEGHSLQVNYWASFLRVFSVFVRLISLHRSIGPFSLLDFSFDNVFKADCDWLRFACIDGESWIGLFILDFRAALDASIVAIKHTSIYLGHSALLD